MSVITVNKQDHVWEDWQPFSGLYTAFLHCAPPGHILWEMFLQREWSSSFSQSFSPWQMVEEWTANRGEKNNFQYVSHLQKSHKEELWSEHHLNNKWTEGNYGTCSLSSSRSNRSGFVPLNKWTVNYCLTIFSSKPRSYWNPSCNVFINIHDCWT